MLTLKKVAVTGGVASGKSSVCQFFKELGAFVVSADAIVHELLKPQSDLGKKILHLLGLQEVSDEKAFRKAIADIVFKDAASLAALEKILHPEVLKKINELYGQAVKQKKCTCFIVEIPLLFEIRGEKFYDVTVAVLADEKIARARLEHQEEYDRRMKYQMNPKQKSIKADYTLLNNGSLEDLKQQVKALYQTIQNN